MFTLYITLISGTVCPLSFYGKEKAVECGLDHLRVPDVMCADVKDSNGNLVWTGIRR